MLRITDGMLVNNTRRHLNSNMLALDEYERQISSGKTISRPSDNPAGTVKSLRLRTSLMEGEQYMDNINEALSFMQTTDASLNDIDEIMQTIREKTVQAATKTNDPDAFNAIAKQINELKDQLKIIANATYGSKYIFAGTNVTETPLADDGSWTGNADWLSVEIGVGVKADINIPQMKSFFTGSMDFTKKLDEASGVSSVQAYNLKGGQYALKTELGDYTDASNIRESQSYLGATANNKSFFYESKTTAATLGVGTGAGAPPLTTDATYSGSLVVEVKSVDQAPHMFVDDSVSNDTQLVMKIDQALYRKDADGTVVPLVNGDDITAMFDMTGLPVDWTAIYNNNGLGNINITFTGATAATDGQSVIATGNFCNSNGGQYTANTATYVGATNTWDYHGVSKVIANVYGHVYATDGTQRDINLINVNLNVEAGANDAIFTIPAGDIDSSVPADARFANDLVIYNAGTNALGGINIRTPALQAGDKTILNFGAAVAAAGADAEMISGDYNYTDINGNQIGNGGFSYVFDPDTMDNRTKDLQFYTMDEETGVIQDGTLTFKTNELFASGPLCEFEYTAGLFGYIDELCGTIQSGKAPQIGNMLKGNDVRLQELLYHRSTIGARVNRLELQQSRLQSSATTLTDLLAKNEDTDEAKVIMELKMQENVYQASLAVGARIIQPTLMDFLS